MTLVYISYFDENTIGPPTNLDWKNARAFSQFQKIYYDVILELSGSLYVTSNLAFSQLALVQSEILKYVANDDHLLCVTIETKRKFDKY